MSKLKLIFLNNNIATTGFSDLNFETDGTYTIATFAKMVVNDYLKKLDIDNISITISNGATSYLLFIQTEYVIDTETILSKHIMAKDLKITTNVTRYNPNGSVDVLVDKYFPININTDLQTFKDYFTVAINSAEEELANKVPKWLVEMFKCYAVGRGDN